jgi:hypothetical protein
LRTDPENAPGGEIAGFRRILSRSDFYRSIGKASGIETI